jgi:hypothetical protein
MHQTLPAHDMQVVCCSLSQFSLYFAQQLRLCCCAFAVSRAGRQTSAALACHCKHVCCQRPPRAAAALHAQRCKELHNLLHLLLCIA